MKGLWKIKLITPFHVAGKVSFSVDNSISRQEKLVEVLLVRIEGLSGYLKTPGLLLTFNLGSCGMGGGKEKTKNIQIHQKLMNLT